MTITATTPRFRLLAIFSVFAKLIGEEHATVDVATGRFVCDRNEFWRAWRDEEDQGTASNSLRLEAQFYRRDLEGSVFGYDSGTAARPTVTLAIRSGS
jgi:hypothetical protein